MKTILISIYHRENIFPAPYSMASLRLGTFINDIHGNEVKIFPIHLNEETKKAVEKIVKESPDILGISAYMWTSSKAKEIAKAVSKLSKKTMIVIGGPETMSLDRQEWPKECVFVVGEGEKILRELCLLKLKNPNISTDDEEIKKINNPSEKCHFPSFDYSHPLFSNYTLSLLENQTYPSKFSWYESARGCPFNCGYCGHKTRPNVAEFDLETVTEEIVNMKNLGIEEIYIIDPIVGGTKERGKSILRLFNKIAPEIKITAFHRPEYIDEEYISILKDTNLRELQIGIQTINPNVPKWVRSNSISQIQEYLPKLTPNKIPWQIDLIIGLPGDDIEGLRKSMAFVVDTLNPRIVRAYRLTVIKNTAIYSVLDKTKNEYWVKMNETNRVTESNSFTAEELKSVLIEGTAITTLYNYFSENNWFGKEKKYRNYENLSKIAEKNLNEMSQSDKDLFLNQKESECRKVWSRMELIV